MNNLFISDQRMLTLMAWAIDKGIADTETEYLEKIGFSRTNMSNVRKGMQGFTKEHIYTACKLTGASADYIFGFTNLIKRKPSKSSIELLKDVVLAVEEEMKKNNKPVKMLKQKEVQKEVQSKISKV